MTSRLRLFAPALLAALVLAAPIARAGDAPLPAATLPGEPTSMAEAKARSAETGRPLLVKVGAEWCGPCKKFDADLAGDTPIRAALEPVVLFRIDAEKGEGPEVAQGLEVQGFPTYVLMTPAGDTIDRWMGYSTPVEFVSTLAAGVADPVPVAVRERRFAEAPTEALAAGLARVADSRGQYAAAVDYYAKAEALKSDPTVDYTLEAFFARAYGVGDGAFTLEQVAEAAGRVLEAPAVTDAEKLDVAVYFHGTAERAGQGELALPVITTAAGIAEATTDPDAARPKTALLVAHALLVEKDPAKALGYRRRQLPEGWRQSSGQLNGFAWWCFENRVNLEEAEQLAREAVGLATDGNQKAACLDTLAEICAARGGCGEAVDHITAAIAEAPESTYYREQLARFEKLKTETGAGR
jgi:thioredoxin-like negative regulator of GroEL